MANFDKFSDPNRYCTGHIGDLPSELVTIYNNTFRPADDIAPGDICDYSSNPSCVGFIAPTDDLLSIYTKDKEFLLSMNITYEQIADKLQHIAEKYRQISKLNWKNAMLKAQNAATVVSLNINHDIVAECGFPYGRCTTSKLQHILKEIILVEDNNVQYLMWNSCSWGYQCCPFRSPKDKNAIFFGQPATGGDNDYWIYDVVNNKSLTFNDLHIHMIREHGFFEGSVPYRLDPGSVINFFNLSSGVDYRCKYRYVLKWEQEYVNGLHCDIPVGPDNSYEINHTKSYDNFDPPSLDRFISYPKDIPSVAELRLFVKERNAKDPIDIIVHGVSLVHQSRERMHEDGFKYVLRYDRELA